MATIHRARRCGLTSLPTIGFARLARALALSAALAAWIAGCGSIRWNPDAEVAPSSNPERAWIPPPVVTRTNEASTNSESLHRLEDKSGAPPSAHPYDLPALIDLALRTNPATQRAWYGARAAEAALGQSQSDNYPKVAADAEAGYFKLPIQFPGQTLVIRNEEFLPQIKVSYDLLDFGRSRATERGAREQLIAANFAFNRAIQDVVFAVEKSYYVLSAANASVRAAEANLTLARTSLNAVQDRHKIGLATGPQVLLAKQLQAQAVYDLENAKSMVHDAESALCETIGVSADVRINVQNIDHQQIPSPLADDLEKLVDDAVKKRPDIAARIAAVRAGEAALDRSEAEFYPEVGIGGNYGQIIWSYTVNDGHTQNLNQPFYGAFMLLRWNLFTGFNRYYGVQKAIAQRNAARAELKQLQLNVIATVWAAYYDVASARKKYEASEALVNASEEAYSANLESHKHGLATITDLIGAERDLMGARYTMVQNKAGLLISASALVHAIGADSASSAAVH